MSLNLMPPETFRATLTHTRALSSSVKEFHFKREDGKPMAFDAGQWVNLALPLASGALKRAYSIASAPNAHGTFELAITRVEGGPGSTFLHDLALGSSIEVTGPQGLFLRQHESASLFVGTGTGITPLRSMFLHALDKGENNPMTVVFGVREEGDQIYREEFKALAQAHPNFSVHYTLSRGSETWPGLRGYVQTHTRELYEKLAAQGECHVYVCGLQKMIHDVRHLLRNEMQLPRQLVHSERYD
jgi:CDP-4-dehydro-6-deoxyglucose reductase, E3